MPLGVGRSGIGLQLESGSLLFVSALSTLVLLQSQGLFYSCPWQQSPARWSVLSNRVGAEVRCREQGLSRAFAQEQKENLPRRQGIPRNQGSRTWPPKIFTPSPSPVLCRRTHPLTWKLSTEGWVLVSDKTLWVPSVLGDFLLSSFSVHL